MKEESRAAGIYQYLRDCQRINHAWENWRDYRQELTSYLLKYTSPGSTAAIFGAGECNDLDLRQLLQHFESVTLYDYDMEAMHRGIERQKAIGFTGLKFRQADFVGIPEEAYIEYTTLLAQECATEKRRETVILQKLEQMYETAEKESLSFGETIYDYTIVIGVDSQLNNMAEWLYRTVYKAEESSVTERICRENMTLVRRFHDAVLKVTGRQLFIGCERACVGREGAIEGALQGLWDIEDRLNRGELSVIQGLSVYWPFDVEQEKIFHMEIWNLKKER